jgi:hypothetical protein
MYLSLKGSLGHTPITDRVGEGPLQIAEGAAAAYSLRNLGSNSPSVVRVRRESDNNERDFTAQDISTSVLTNWVNEQIVPPLDIGVLTPEGRIPVPEGGTSIGTPAAAYSLRNLSTTYTGNVVDVRRSSDDTEDSFTAAEVADGTLATWVGAGNDGFVSQWYDQSGNDNHATQGTLASQPKIVDGGSLVSGGLDFDGVNDELNFDSSVSLSTNDFYCASVISILDGNTVNITPVSNAAGNRFLISLNYDADQTQMRADDGSFLTQPFTRAVPANETLISISNVSNTATLRCETISAAVFDTTGKSFTLGSMGERTPNTYSKHSIKELIIYNADQSNNRTAIEANIGEVYGITGIPAYDNTVNGFVETWYDQSGNGNDATQSVAGSQPKIVDGGVIVTNDEGNPAIQGAVGKYFNLSTITGLTDVSIFFVGTVPSYFQAITGWNTNLHMLRFGTLSWEFIATSTNAGNMDWNSALTAGDTALFNFTRSSGTVTGYANSVASETTSNANSNLFGLNRIFNRSNASYNDYLGKAAELFLYSSDQSANRVAIETNINDHYNIY